MGLSKWYAIDPVPIAEFFAKLTTFGIRLNDPRLQPSINKIRENNICETDPKAKVSQELFKSAVAPCVSLVAKAFRNQLIIPDFVSFTKDIECIYHKCKSNTLGDVATYIPELSRADPNYWGVSICTIDGQRYSIGDSCVKFTMQSCTKPITYAMALELLGQDLVHQYVGQEPSGRNFNELLLDFKKKPHNPMINAGAILICALLKELVEPKMCLYGKSRVTCDWFRRLAGNEEIGFNDDVFQSEREAADRNFAIGYYMREHKCFPENTDLKECLDFYFKCCSMETTCDPVAVIAATLANGGICPLTNEQILRTDVVRDVLSLAASCGMYDYSGQFAFNVGIPAKSGVSGALLIVVPNILGICTFSPPLDALGNTVRGLQFCQELVQIFNFHRYDNLSTLVQKKDPRRPRHDIKNMLMSARLGHLSDLRKFKADGLDFMMSDYDGRTALHFAASGGHLDCVRFLVEECVVPLSVADRWGNHPLDEADAFGEHQVLKYLREMEFKKKK